MNPRLQLRRTLSFSHDLPPPRYESEFSEEVIEAWTGQGKLGGPSPEEYFHLDRRETVPVEWRRLGEGKFVLESEKDLERFRAAYDENQPGRLPEGWKEQVLRWRERDFALSITPWNEGFLQVIGIAEARSFNQAMFGLRDRPSLIEAAMDHYADFLVALLDRVLGQDGVEVDYAVFYAPIASRHAPVVSPGDYARFALPAMRHLVECLEHHGVAFRFVWTTGRIEALIPLWLDAGINGLILTQAAAAGLSYPRLRREYESRLRFFGGVDRRAVVQGPEAIDRVLETEVRPLLEQGGYVPHLDDTVREFMPFDHFCYYRRELDALVDEVFASRRPQP